MIATATIPTTEVSPWVTPVAGIDLITIRERDADHLAMDIAAALAARGAGGITVATHWAQVGLLRHVALSVHTADTPTDTVWTVLSDLAAHHGGPSGVLLDDRYEGQPELQAVLTQTVTAHATRSSGRAVVFLGSAALTGTLTVGHAVAASALDRVRILAVGDADPGTALVTRDFVRPRWDTGNLVLDAQAAAGDTLVPFETPTPTPCCADHP